MSEFRNALIPAGQQAPPSERGLVTWGQISAYLLDVEQRRLWEGSADSFSQWIAEFAQRRGRSVALIWRILTAGRFYRERLEAYAAKGQALPDLAHVPTKVSPDSMEILEKLSRVASRHLLDDLEPRALRGQASRTELRAAWEAYRPLLEGRTARGKNVDAPKVPEVHDTDGRPSDSRAEADCLVGLQRDGGAWAGHPDPKAYRLVASEKTYRVADRTKISIDAVAVIQPSGKALIEVHGIQIKPMRGLALGRDVLLLPVLVDYAWVALATPGEAPDLSGIPGDFGVLAVTVSSVSVLRKARLIKRDHTGPEELLRELLLRSLRA